MQHYYTPLSPTTFLERSGQAFANRTAIASPNTKVTYAQLLHRSRCLAQVLKRLGVEYGDRVALLSENNQQTIEAHFSIPAVGAVIVALNPWLAVQDIGFQLDYCEAKVLIIDAAFSEKILLYSQLAFDHLQKIIVINGATNPAYSGYLDYETCLAGENGDFRLDQTIVDELDPICINFTSGTTGRPKGVMSSHRAAYLNALGQALMIGLNRSSKYLWLLPMFHVNGWGHMWVNVAVGATQIILPGDQIRDASTVCQAVAGYKITHLSGAPRLVRSLAFVPGDKAAFDGLTITTGGAAPAPTLIERLDEMGVKLIHQYGLNETFGPYTVCEEQEDWQELSPASRALKRGRQGVATIHAGTGLRVVDATSQDVPWDGSTLGEVIVAGNTVATGYYNNPEATAKAFCNGWFHTGDVAIIHPDGYLEIRDRMKDLIYVETEYGWENISSIEIENVLCQHEQVRDAAVIGISPEELGRNSTLLVAFIEVWESQSITKEDLRRFCESRLSAYKQPEVFFFTDLPKTATGKVRKDVLVKEALNLSELKV
ncbi:AMP-binding protein [Nostoc sp. PCC 7107]|uniref:AMP-binding protein n=1 Tax=Nostoc sp. PCC 7107 TaxID=317936 RepID=UPI00029F46F8|nr:AMP-binding protein [Nostoc sp. PCC 7107]AFY41650.1 o-succinylbenzoate--CoA ligase [Nostoc sp. PCC 7107]